MANFLKRAQQKPVVATAGGSGNSTKADKRLEYDLDHMSGATGKVAPINPPSLRDLKVIIKPPAPSIWAGGEFWFKLSFKDDYPDVPPVCRYMGPRRIWHPNIEGDEGKQDWGVCLSSINASKDYSPVMGVRDFVMGLEMMFFEPTPQDPLPGTAHRAAQQLVDNAADFAKQAKSWTQGNYIELPSARK